jgi:hypothetical protein
MPSSFPDQGLAKLNKISSFKRDEIAFALYNCLFLSVAGYIPDSA